MSRVLIILLAFVAGWVDASSFVGLDHVMAAHVTGNLVVLAANVAEGFEPNDLLKIAVLPIFFTAVMILTAIHDRLWNHFGDPPRQVAMPLRVEAALIAGTGFLGIWASLAGWSLGLWTSLVIVTPVLCGMAVQNATHRLYPVIGPATTVMTGNIAQFFIDQTRRIAGRSSVSLINDMPRQQGLLPFLILAFGTGCVSGALLTAALGNGSFLVPALLIAFASRLPKAKPQ